MKRFKILFVTMAVIALLATLTACGGDNGNNDAQAETKTTLRIATIPISRVATESGVAPLEEMGYEVEIIMFDDYVTPDTALDEGSIDANLYQHQQFLDNFNAEHGTDIVMLAPCVYYFGGIYSENYTSLDDLKANGAGGKIAVQQDATNQSMDLLAIEEAGLITLTDEEKALYSIADIVDNPYNFEFVYMTRNVIYSSREELAAYMGTSNTMVEFGLDPTENQLYYVNYIDDALGICVNAKDADTQWAQDILTAYTSDEAKQYVLDNAGSAVLPIE